MSAPPNVTSAQTKQLLPLQIAMLHGKFNAQARKLLSQFTDLTLPEWRVMRVLGLGIGRSSATLRKATLMDKGQFSRILNTLVERDLVVAQTSAQDQRQWDLELTALGRATYAEIAPALDSRQAHLTAALTPDELRVLMIAIGKLGLAAEVDITLEIHKTGVDQT